MQPDVTAVVFDGAVLVNVIKPKSSKTFQDYSTEEFVPYIESQLQKFDRLGIVWDQYFPHSLKEQTREARSQIVRRRVSATTVVPRNWCEFLRNAENKQELFVFLSQEMSRMNVGRKQLFIACGQNIITNDTDTNDTLEPCTHEEADSRMLLHAADAADCGHKKLMIRTVDTDVVVLAMAHFEKITVDKLWISFGTGKAYRLIPAHDTARSFGQEKAALLFFHAITGCDTTSAFSGKGKNNCLGCLTCLFRSN